MQTQFTADWTKSAFGDEKQTAMHEQIRKLQVLLKQKQSEIDTMQQWMYGDEYLKQDAVLQDKMKEF